MPTPNLILARAAISAITDTNFETAPSFCCRFVREVVESVYTNGTYDSEFAGTARLTGLNFLVASLGQRYHGEDLVPGDILFKLPGSGYFGHVGIYVDQVPGHDGRNLIAENSSTDIGRIQGAKGYRSVEQWGHVDAVVRLPSLAVVAAVPEPRLVIARRFMSADKVRWAYTAVSSAVYDAPNQHFTVNQSQLASLWNLAAQSVRLPVRDAMANIGVTIDEAATATGNQLADKLDPRQYVFLN